MAKRPRHRRRRSVCLILAAASAVLPSARALADDFWTGLGDGISWSDPNNWSAGVPGNGDSASIITTGSTAVAVNYDYTASPITLAALTLDLTAGSTSATNTFNLSANTLTTTAETIGLNGSGTFNQSAGLNDTITLNLAVNPNSAGFYTQSGGTANVTGNTYIGGSSAGPGGQGVLTVSNTASFTTSGTLKAWNTPGTQINLNGGSITAETLDLSGNSSLLNWSGGALTIAGTAGLVVDSATTPSVGPSLVIGPNNSLAVTIGKNVGNVGEYVGNSATGSITQTGGINIITGTRGVLFLGYNANSTGTYNLSGGSLSAAGSNLPFGPQGDEYVGYSGVGIFNQTGGTNTVAASLDVPYGNSAQSTGSYTLNGGSLSAPTEDIGVAHLGTFNQTAGTNAVISLYLGGGTPAHAGTGIYLLSGSGVLSAYAEVIQNWGGTFSQSGGSNNINTAGQLSIGYGGALSSTTGTYNLSGSAILTSGNEAVGDGGAGCFNQSGGANLIQGTGSLFLGGGPPPLGPSSPAITSGSGTYNLGGSTSTLTVTSGNEFVGYAAYGVLNQSNGTNTISAGNLYISDSVTIFDPDQATFYGTGVYVMTGGSAVVNGNVVIGNGAGGTLTVSGTASLTASGSLLLTNTAKINLLGGTITAASFTGFGPQFNWASGTLNITGAGGLSVFGYSPLPNQTLNVTNALTIPGGATLTTNFGSITAATLAIQGGTFYQTAGNLNFNTISQTGGNAYYDPTGGTLSVSNFNQTGGSADFNSSAGLQLAPAPGTTMTYTISGGMLNSTNASVGGSAQAAGGQGDLTISGGGEFTVGLLKVWNTPGTHVNFAGGTLIANTLDLSGNPSLFNWSSGTLSYNSPSGLTIGGGPLGNSLTLMPGQNLYIPYTLSVASSGILSIAGGAVTTSSLNTFGNPSAIQWTSGSLIISGTGSFALSPTGPLGNSLTLVTGQNLTLGKPLSFSPSASLAVNGASVTVYSLSYSGSSPISFTNGTFTITGGSTLSISPTGPMGSTLSVVPGQNLTVAGELSVNTGGSLALNGGSVSAGSLDTAGNPAAFQWNSGVLTIIGTGGLSLSPAGPLGNSLDLIPGDTLTVSKTLALGTSSVLVLNGGSVTTGALDSSVNPTALQWTSGALTVTGTGGLTVNPADTLGNSFLLVPGQGLTVANKLTLASSASLALDGGSINVGTLNLSPGSYFNWITGSLTISGTAGIVVDTVQTPSVGPSFAIGNNNLSVVCNEYVGPQGTGTLTQSGGTNSAQAIYLACGSASNGNYILSGGSANIANEYVGNAASALGTISQSNGTNTVGNLYLGYAASSTGAYTLSGGTLAGSNEALGNATGASGNFTHFNGTNTASNLTLGSASNSTGAYALNGGSVNITSEIIASAANSRGSFSQTAGTNTASSLTLANTNPSTGTYTLAGGSANITNEYVGYSGQSTFTQAGGSNTAINLYLGCYGASTGTYILNGGAAAITTEYIGYGRVGMVNQTGGTNSTTRLILGTFGATSGNYALSGGSATVAGDASVGNMGVGVFNVTGSGTLSVGGALNIAAAPSLLNLQGGTISAGSITTGGYPADVHWTSGTLNITGTGGLSLSPSGPLGNTLSLSTGQNLGVSNTLAIASTAALSITGGSFTAGATANSGSIQHSFGTAAFGALTGTGTLQIGGSTGSPAVESAVSLSQSAVTVNSTGVLQILQNNPGVTNSIGSLVINGGGQIDITNNGLLLNETNNPLSQVTTWVQNQAITSSLVNGPNSQASRAIGYGDSSEDPLTIPAGEVEVKYVPTGDVNLDGRVDITDLTTALNDLGLSAGYGGGDVLNQGMVNSSDITVIINDLGATLNSSGTSDPAIMMQTQDSSVPEPASLGLLTAGGLGLLARRRRGAESARSSGRV